MTEANAPQLPSDDAPTGLTSSPTTTPAPAPSPVPIRIGLIGGSGLGAALGAQTQGTRHVIETPFGSPSDAIIETTWAGLPVFFLSRHGPGHTLNPGQVPYRANLFALKTLGVTHILASGAVGSLREEFRPRDLVIPDQIIDKTHRPGTFYEKAAVHVEFAEPFDPVLRRILLDVARAGSDAKVQAVGQDAQSAASPGPSPGPMAEPMANAEPSHKVHDRGCYVAMEGPAFSTRAESLMHRLWGGDLIGMTAMPEAKLAREAEMAYALVALVTDYDCWRQKPAAAVQTAGQVQQPHAPELDPFVLLKEIIANLEAATNNAVALLRRAVERMAERQEELRQSPALQSLRLGIWSDKSSLDPQEVQVLAPLWGRYFDARTPG